MNFISKYIASYQVKKTGAAPRVKQFVKLSDASSVGILFDATDREDFETIKKFIQQLKDLTKGIHAIGYIDAKVTPNLSYIKTDIDLFNRKEITRLYQPQSPYIKTFIETERDLLIDANIGNKLPLRYIAAASKARCKVGVHTAGNEAMHDVLLNLGANNGLEIFLQQTLKYLT
jgi:hypothetical protein